ncbi:hypothetical protein B0H16DRAFT_1714501 [Mycena metata]|uniref:Uncharacterized protein n=1 Tax=Mycena metata TaxID=1033252 RepID=A0AAD7JUY6_9AGAR|nr:hypothetical protein B0H16DRAFT_1714501 [Mycena metata]
MSLDHDDSRLGPVGCSLITVLGNNCGDTTVVCDAPDEQWGEGRLGVGVQMIVH